MKKKDNKDFYDLIIIGGGPAGLTCGVYVGRSGLKVLILEKEAPGGKLIKTYEIENYPGFKRISGVDLATKMFDHAVKYSSIYEDGEVKKIINESKNIKIVVTNKKKYKCHAIIVVTGTKERELNIPGEKKYFSMGVSTCAVCDGALFKNEIMAVVGGGWSATEEALYLTRFAKKIYLVHRRQNLEFQIIFLKK